MKKEFKNKEEFIGVISGITKDGSVIMDLKGGVPNVPKEKQFPFVEKAKEMDLEKAIESMPTALRFELIKKGYEFLFNGLRLEELDGTEDYWPRRMTSFIPRKHPEYESKVNWDKLKNTWLVNVIIDQPQFIDKVDFSKIDVRSSADLIAKRPDLALKFNLSSFNTSENSQYWFKILEKQPQFATSCDWSLINDYQKTKLKQIHPNINTSN